ncbi:hypothetical protein BOTBODRAFT_47880 [Botryobasidium botryosum FD-172 SS1]|uniref:Uncharacterized protein n=1 Tax=Botryobasidium botryosum (strain FD-172 SS1) TaxID=930990 RepID=A0A067MBT6_BOTB1|nr:hypothetical protein BOTBODRAFT_47880 [Botryobasidium botryosum FD-172 SS1]
MAWWRHDYEFDFTIIPLACNMLVHLSWTDTTSLSKAVTKAVPSISEDAKQREGLMGQFQHLKQRVLAHVTIREGDTELDTLQMDFEELIKKWEYNGPQEVKLSEITITINCTQSRKKVMLKPSNEAQAKFPILLGHTNCKDLAPSTLMHELQLGDNSSIQILTIEAVVSPTRVSRQALGTLSSDIDFTAVSALATVHNSEGQVVCPVRGQGRELTAAGTSSLSIEGSISDPMDSDELAIIQELYDANLFALPFTLRMIQE